MFANASGDVRVGGELGETGGRKMNTGERMGIGTLTKIQPIITFNSDSHNNSIFFIFLDDIRITFVPHYIYKCGI